MLKIALYLFVAGELGGLTSGILVWGVTGTIFLAKFLPANYTK